VYSHAAGAPHALEKGRDGARRVHLNHLVQIADVNPQLHRGCTYDRRGSGPGKLLLGQNPVSSANRAVDE